MDTKTGEDRFQEFRKNMTAETWYRRAYDAVKLKNPDAVAGLTDPDEAPPGFDFGAELDKLRRADGKLRAVPPLDLTT